MVIVKNFEIVSALLVFQYLWEFADGVSGVYLERLELPEQIWFLREMEGGDYGKSLRKELEKLLLPNSRYLWEFADGVTGVDLEWAELLEQIWFLKEQTVFF